MTTPDLRDGKSVTRMRADSCRVDQKPIVRVKVKHGACSIAVDYGRLRISASLLNNRGNPLSPFCANNATGDRSTWLANTFLSNQPIQLVAFAVDPPAAR